MNILFRRVEICYNISVKKLVGAKIRAKENSPSFLRTICVFFRCRNKKNHSKSNDLKWFTWQREKDSNPHIRSQSPLCYLYTIPLNAKSIIQTFFNLSSIRRKLFL